MCQSTETKSTAPRDVQNTDLLEWKKEKYLLIVDYTSQFIEVAWLK